MNTHSVIGPVSLATALSLNFVTFCTSLYFRSLPLHMETSKWLDANLKQPSEIHTFLLFALKPLFYKIALNLISFTF